VANTLMNSEIAGQIFRFSFFSGTNMGGPFLPNWFLVYLAVLVIT
jgi:hypothetical protein